MAQKAPQGPEGMKVFNAYKDTSRDRQLGDRRIANQRQYALPGPSQFLPQGFLLCNLSLKKFTEVFETYV